MSLLCSNAGCLHVGTIPGTYAPDARPARARYCAECAEPLIFDGSFIPDHKHRRRPSFARHARMFVAALLANAALWITPGDDLLPVLLVAAAVGLAYSSGLRDGKATGSSSDAPVGER